MENERTKEERLVEMDNWLKASGWTKDKAPVWTEDQVRIVYRKTLAGYRLSLVMTKYGWFGSCDEVTEMNVKTELKSTKPWLCFEAAVRQLEKACMEKLIMDIGKLEIKKQELIAHAVEFQKQRMY